MTRDTRSAFHRAGRASLSVGVLLVLCLLGTGIVATQAYVNLNFVRDGYQPVNGTVAVAGDTTVHGLISPSAFAATGSMTTSRSFHTATLLPDGRVLITGGTTNQTGTATDSSAELYIPSAHTFTPTGTMTTARSRVTATLLDDGRGLITGDFFAGAVPLKSTAELFDPSTGTFTRTGDMITAQLGATATLLNNGKVLIAGGVTSLCCEGPNPAPAQVATPEVYDPSTGTFSLTGPFESAGDGFFVTRPWPQEFVCRSVRVVAPTDGIMTLEALSTQGGARPGLEVETVGGGVHVGNPILGNPTSIQVTAGTEVLANVEIIWGSTASQSFTLNTSMAPQ